MQAVQQAVAQVMALKDRYESMVMECVANGRLYVSSLQNLNAETQKLCAVAVQHARAHHETHALDIETQEKLVAMCTDAVGVLHQTCVVSFDILATMQTEFAELKQSTQRTIDTAIENNTEHSDRKDLAYLLVRVKLTRVRSSHLENVVRQMNFLEHLINTESEKAPSSTHSHKLSEHSESESWTLWLGSQEAQRNHFADAVQPLAQALVARAYPPVPAEAFPQRAQVSCSSHADARPRLARANPALHELCARVAHIAALAHNEHTVAVAAHRFAVEIRENSILVSRALLDKTELRLLRRCLHRALHTHVDTDLAESRADSALFVQQSRGDSHSS
jgi:hypothetical protein